MTGTSAISPVVAGVTQLPLEVLEARWWRGNLHTHTLLKSGDDFPEMVVDWYKSNGYQFLTLTEHNLLNHGQMWCLVKNIDSKANTNAFARYVQTFGSSWVETRNESDPDRLEVRLKPNCEFSALFNEPGRFLVIQGEEITGAIHINAINLNEVIQPHDGATARETIMNNLAAVQKSALRSGHKVMAILNHPNFRWDITAEDLAGTDAHFFEVWNGVIDDNDPGDASHPSTDEIWDVANTLRIARGAQPLYGLANDDTHNYHGNNPYAPPGRAWVMVRSRHLTPEALISAMELGEFYASTGVVLRDIRYNSSYRKLSLDIEAPAGETFVTRFIGTREGANLQGKPRCDTSGQPVKTTLDYNFAEATPIGEVLAEVAGTHPSYVFRGDELYVRAIVTSSAAPDVPSTEFPFKRAWTQPVGW